MDWQAVVLALIQGITEFLPISSSAHLLLPKEILGWPDQGLAFDVAVHLGTLAAVLFHFRREIWQLLLALTPGQDMQRQQGRHLVLCLVVATLPAGLAGLLLESTIETYLRTALVIAITTLIGAGLLWLADRVARSAQARDMASMTLLAALLIGLAQATALVPGTSRSGITITMALLLGFSRTSAARFSFLLAIPIIALSAGWQALELLQETAVDWRPMALAVPIAGLSAWACIRLFLAAIERLGMLPFVLYRLALGLFLLAWVALQA